MKIKGIFTPNVVPFHSDNTINEGELRRYISWLIDKGVTGIYPNGSAGEFIRLSFEQRIRLMEIIVDEAKGRVPILAGAAEANIELVLKACRRFADLLNRPDGLSADGIHPSPSGHARIAVRLADKLKTLLQPYQLLPSFADSLA